MRYTFSEMRRRRVFRAAAIYFAVAWGLTEIMGFLVPALRFPPWVLTIVAIIFVLGFPVAMFLSWVFEIDENGIRKTEPTSHKGEFTIVASGLFLVAATAGLFYLIYPEGIDQPAELELVAYDPPPNSVAILPFRNLGGVQEDSYFSDGLAEELLNTLASYEGLLVKARTSSFAFRGQDFDVRFIGRRLNVSRIVEGSVQRSGQQLRIRVQLIDAVDGHGIWSDTYERTMQDIFDVQEEISRAIAQALQLKVAASNGRSPTRLNPADVKAYDLYLQGRHLWHQRTARSIQAAIDLFEQAIEADPSYVLAYTGLADAYNLLTAYGSLSGPAAARLMRDPVERAMSLDSEQAEVFTSLGAMQENLGELEAAEAAYRTAIKLNGNYSLAYMWLGNVLVNQSRIQDAEAAFMSALALDPLNVAVNLNVARANIFQGRYDRAMTFVSSAEEIHPDSALIHQVKSDWMREYGLLDKAVLSATRAQELDPKGVQVIASLATAHMDLGNFDEAKRWIESAIALGPGNWQVVWAVCDYHFLRGEYAALDNYVTARLNLLTSSSEGSASRDIRILYFWAGLARLLTGDTEAAAGFLDKAFAANMQFKLDLDDELYFLGLRALAHHSLGHQEIAARHVEDSLLLADDVLALGWSTPYVMIRRAGLELLAGRKQTALDQLAAAAESGFKNYQSLQRDPTWTSVAGDPRFVKALEIMRAETEQMRALVPAKDEQRRGYTGGM